jgi:hypothetical protein
VLEISSYKWCIGREEVLGVEGMPKTSEEVLSEKVLSEEVLSEKVLSEEVLSEGVLPEEVLPEEVLPEEVAQREANLLVKVKQWSPWRYQVIVDLMAKREGDNRREHYLRVLKMLQVTLSAKRDRSRLYQIGRAMTTTLSGFQLRKFVEEAIKQKAISDDFIHTAVTLNQYGVDPHIILDFMAHSTMNRKTLNEFVIMLPKVQVAQVVDLAAGMIGDTDHEKIARLQSLESFPNDYLQDVDVSKIWSDRKNQDFLENVCGRMQIPIPGNVRVVRM